MQTSLTATAAAADVAQAAPSLIIKHHVSGDSKVFLVFERSVICKVPAVEVPIVIMAAYYAYNMQYPSGLKNLYTLFELELCGITPKKLPRNVERMLTCLSLID